MYPVINEWNSLPMEIKISESIGSFMNKLKNKKENSPPPYFSCGNRGLNIIHTRLRHNCILNKDLLSISLYVLVEKDKSRFRKWGNKFYPQII
jgi:hypothetical protein